MTPVLLLDYERLENNIKRMAEKAKENSVNLRPHIKTHKCIEIGKMQTKYGARGITVSTLDEASIFADAGFSEITYAVTMSSNKINAALDIANKTNLRLLVDNQNIVSNLEKAAVKRGVNLEILLKVHTGYHRTGVDPRSSGSIRLARTIADAKHLYFKGILTHAGHSYDSTTKNQIKEVAMQEQMEMLSFSRRLESESSELKPEIVSIGSTPTMTLTDVILEGITEIRPGNYVFYDYTQVALGSCQISDCVLTAVSRVIGKYDGYFVIDAGATALSKDLGPTHIEPETSFGKIYADYDKHELETGLILYSLSQEHGKVTFGDSSIIQEHKIDDIVRILPNHSCLTANLHDCYYIVKDDQISDKWRIRRDRPITSAC